MRARRETCGLEETHVHPCHFSAFAISPAHSWTASQSRKSPSGDRTAVTIALSANVILLLSNLPAKRRWPFACVRSGIAPSLTAASPSGFGGSPIGPLEKSQVGFFESSSACSSAKRRALRNQRPAYTPLPSTTES